LNPLILRKFERISSGAFLVLGPTQLVSPDHFSLETLTAGPSLLGFRPNRPTTEVISNLVTVAAAILPGHHRAARLHPSPSRFGLKTTPPSFPPSRCHPLPFPHQDNAAPSPLHAISLLKLSTLNPTEPPAFSLPPTDCLPLQPYKRRCHLKCFPRYPFCIQLISAAPQCDRTPLKKQGFVSQNHIEGFSMKREYRNTIHKHTISWYSSYKVVIIF
jgi:hypothetical protein